jgi:hypothetical protein
MQGCVYCDGHRERVVIELPDGEDYGIYAIHAGRRRSKQVAREAVAAGAAGPWRSLPSGIGTAGMVRG